MKTVVIVGVGLIGGSFGLALRRAGFTGTIVGVSRPDAIVKALRCGAIDTAGSLEQAAPDADLIYLSQPISKILEVISILKGLAKPQALVTDAGSTKAAIVAAAEGMRARFLGGHPLAGKETRGIESATPELFEGRGYVLTPHHEADLDTPSIQFFTRWLRKIGAIPIVMNPNDHDRTLAFTSHLPQLASTALAALLHRTGSGVDEVFGPALIDSTRLALSSYEVWRDIFETNHGAVEQALEEYIETLQGIRNSLRNSNLTNYFYDGAEFASKIRRR